MPGKYNNKREILANSDFGFKLIVYEFEVWLPYVCIMFDCLMYNNITFIFVKRD